MYIKEADTQDAVDETLLISKLVCTRGEAE